MNLKDNELLITGASGHSAKYFFNRLVNEKYGSTIKCLVRRRSQLDHLKDCNLKFNFIVQDFDDLESLRDSMRGVKVVLHIASIFLSEIVVRTGSEMGVEWFVCVHTTGRYSNLKKARKDYIGIEDGLLNNYSNLTILRPTIIYGGVQDKNIWKLIKYIDRHKFFPVFGSGENLMQPVHAEDLGNAYYGVLNNRSVTSGKQYNLSGKNSISYINILRLIALLLKKDVYFIRLPIWLCAIVAWIVNLILPRRFPIQVEQVLRMREDKVFSWEEASKDFNYTPMSFEDGIRREVAEYLGKKDSIC